MPDLFRKSLCVVLAWVLILTAVPAQQPSPAPRAPVPPQILSAHKVFVSNGGGTNEFQVFTGGTDRAYNTFYADLEKENRYELVSSPKEADLIFEIRAIAPTSGFGDNVSSNPQLVLKILDPQTNATLWTTSANVRAFGTQARRDAGFDRSVAVLVSKLSEVTGQPLTQSETKAVRDNSRMPTGMKVFIVVSIVGAAAFAAWGAYRVSHPPSLPPLPTPAVHF